MVGLESLELSLPNDTLSASAARRSVSGWLSDLGLDPIAPTIELVVTELVANAVLHTDGPVDLRVEHTMSGIRVTVTDTSSVLPVVPNLSSSGMTGRGLLMVRSLATRMGFDPLPQGKKVWAELPSEIDANRTVSPGLVEAWADDLELPVAPDNKKYVIELGDVPTDLLLAAKSHVDNLVREFMLAAKGAEAGETASVPPPLARLIEAVVKGFADARLSIKRQALDASRRGADHVQLRLELGPESAEAGEAYLEALDEADVYCRAARLLTLETPPEHRVFRHWYVGEIVTQLRRAEAGLPPVPPQRFEDRLLHEIRAVAAAWAAADRAARLYSVSSALAGALTTEAVSAAVISEGAAALGASGGGLLLPAGRGRLMVSGTVGYDERLIANLNSESAGAELPAALALRTGEAVWMESREERDRRFPELRGFERDTVSMCAVPLQLGERRLGALRFSFSEPRLFDADERRFVMALAAQAAQALDRARLYQDRSDLSRRLQRSLLPPALPVVPGLDIGAAYHPLGDGMEVGGDFYDMWELGDDRWAFALGDVCGKGPEAAALTALVRYSLRAITESDPDLAAVLTRLNHLLLTSSESEERFCTVMFGILTHADGHAQLDFATGGHPGPVIARADGEISVVPTSGSLLGVFPELSVGTYSVSIGPGDRAVIYTDGVTEARSEGEMFGTEGLIAAVEAAPGESRGAALSIEGKVLDYSGGTLLDDLAVLVIRKE